MSISLTTGSGRQGQIRVMRPRPMMSSITRLARIVGVGLLLTACATLPGKRHSVKTEGGYCVPALRYNYDAAYTPETLPSTDSSLTRRFSQHDLLLANAAGLLPLLRKLVRAQPASTLSQRLEVVEIRQKILSRLLIVSTDVSSLAAELDCEGERADQLATYLDQKDTRRIRRLTLASIVAGAITTVITALVQSDQTSKVVGIGGGIISGGLGGLAAFSSNKTVRFMHERNLLADIWNQSRQSVIYSPFVWYVLNEKLFSNSGQHSISYNTRQRWQGFALDGSSKEAAELYFGGGGDYQADDLHTRSNMLNQVQSSVRSISQDLQSLMLNLPE